MSLNDIYDFPVGDDPSDPDVLTYWSGVADRMSRMLLPREMDWTGAIRDRIREYEASVAALRAADEASLEAAVRRVRLAAMEFPRLKWKLTDHVVRHFGHEHPGMVALFGRPATGEDN